MRMHPGRHSDDSLAASATPHKRRTGTVCSHADWAQGYAKVESKRRRRHCKDRANRLEGSRGKGNVFRTGCFLTLHERFPDLLKGLLREQDLGAKSIISGRFRPPPPALHDRYRYCTRTKRVRVLVSNGPPGWQIVLSSRLGCLHCVVAAGGEGKAGAGAETSVEYSG